MAFRIDENRCVGCGGCAFACLFDAITAANDDASLYIIDESKCVECSQCSHVCPNDAIVTPEGYRRIKKVSIVAEKCKGCSLCVKSCPFDAITIVDRLAVIGDGCVDCGVCMSRCPYGLETPKLLRKSWEDYQKVLSGEISVG